MVLTQFRQSSKISQNESTTNETSAGLQLTFLHVYHHGTMPFVIWFGANFAPGGNSVFATAQGGNSISLTSFGVFLDDFLGNFLGHFWTLFYDCSIGETLIRSHKLSLRPLRKCPSSIIPQIWFLKITSQWPLWKYPSSKLPLLNSTSMVWDLN